MSRLLFSFPLVWCALALSPAHAADDSQVIFPKTTASSTAPAESGRSGLGATTVLGVLVLAGAGGWLVVRGRSVKIAGRETRSLAINETRSLGNRQYLVVASYEGRKFLLGVCPGRIDLLSPIAEGQPQTKAVS